MCIERNSRCVLYNRSRGKEGRVEKDYRQNSLPPPPRFFLVCLVKLEVYLFLSFYTFSSLLPPPLSVPFHTLLSSFFFFSESWEASLLESFFSQSKCRSSVFGDSLHTDAEEEMEGITSFSAPSAAILHSHSTLTETLKGLPTLHLCHLSHPMEGLWLTDSSTWSVSESLPFC